MFAVERYKLSAAAAARARGRAGTGLCASVRGSSRLTAFGNHSSDGSQSLQSNDWINVRSFYGSSPYAVSRALQRRTWVAAAYMGSLRSTWVHYSEKMTGGTAYFLKIDCASVITLEGARPQGGVSARVDLHLGAHPSELPIVAAARRRRARGHFEFMFRVWAVWSDLFRAWARP